MRDVVAALLWLAVNAFVFWSGWRLSCWLFPQEGLGRRGQQVLVLCWAEVVGLALLLGSWGGLSATTLLGGAVLLACALLGVIHHFPRTATSPPAAASGEPSLRRSRFWAVFWYFLLALLLAWVVQEGVLRFPQDWDTLTYHLPLIVQWLHQGSLYAPAEANWANPGNNELLGLWCVALFSGDFLISLNNLPAIVLLGLSAVGLAEQLGLRSGLRHLCGLAVLVHYAIPNQAVTAGNDVAAAALFLTALDYQLRYLGSAGSADLLLAAISLGLLAGVKYYALGYALLAGVSLVLLAGLVQGRRSARRALLAACLGVLLWGSYWYLRNLLLTGTPLYPKGLTESTDLMGRIRPDRWWQTSLLGSGQPAVYPLLWSAIGRLAGPVHLLAVLSWPLIQVWLLLSALWLTRREANGPTVWQRLALSLWLPAAGLLWGLTPFSVTAVPGTLDMLIAGFSPLRYGLCFLSLALLALGRLLQDLALGLHWLCTCWQRTSGSQERWSFRRLAALGIPSLPLVFFALAVVYQGYTGLFVSYPLRRQALPSVALLGCDLALAGGLLLWSWHSWPWLRPVLFLAGPLGLAAACFPLQQHWHEGFTRFYDRHFQDRLLEHYLPTWNPADTRICALAYRYYPFFGSRRQFQVCRPLWLPTYASLLEYLARHRSTVVITAPAQEGFDRYGRVASWLPEHPQTFFLQEKGAYWQAWRVSAEQLAQELSTSDP